MLTPSQTCPDGVWNGLGIASHPPDMGALVPGLDFCSTLDCFTHGLCPSTSRPSQESETRFEDKLMSVALHSAASQVLPRTSPVRACHPSCPENPTAVCSTCLMALAAQPALCTLPTALFCPRKTV